MGENISVFVYFDSEAKNGFQEIKLGEKIFGGFMKTTSDEPIISYSDLNTLCMGALYTMGPYGYTLFRNV